jgi:hypothetical protein
MAATIKTRPIPVSDSALPRFWQKVDKTQSCWLWTGTINNKGYGRLNIGRVGFYVHRLSYQITNGVIEPGMVVLHHCDNPRCVNPDHLSLGTQADNLADMRSKGRGFVMSRAPMPNVCSRGKHAFPEHCRLRKNGARYCKGCHKDYGDAHYDASARHARYVRIKEKRRGA